MAKRRWLRKRSVIVDVPDLEQPHTKTHCVALADMIASRLGAACCPDARYTDPRQDTTNDDG